MKTITLDYDTYQEELKEQFKRGAESSAPGIEEARDLIRRVVNKDVLLSTDRFYEWLNKYGTD